MKQQNRLAEFVKPKTTFKDIAQRYGCTISFVCHIAYGRRPAPTRFKLICSELLGLPVSLIFPNEGGSNE